MPIKSFLDTPRAPPGVSHTPGILSIMVISCVSRHSRLADILLGYLGTVYMCLSYVCYNHFL